MNKPYAPLWLGDFYIPVCDMKKFVRPFLADASISKEHVFVKWSVRWETTHEESEKNFEVPIQGGSLSRRLADVPESKKIIQGGYSVPFIVPPELEKTITDRWEKDIAEASRQAEKNANKFFSDVLSEWRKATGQS